MDVSDGVQPFDDDGTGDWVSDLVRDHFDHQDAPDPVAEDLDPDHAGADLFDDGADPSADVEDAPELELPHDLDIDDQIDTAAHEDADLDVDDAVDAGEAADDSAPEISLDLDDAFDDSDVPGSWPDLDLPEPGDGALGLAAVEHALDALGGHDLDSFLAAADQLGLGADLDLGLDGHSTAVVLGEIGVDALVEHGSLDDLAERIRTGDEVLVTAADGTVLVVTDIDRTAVTVVPVAGGPAHRVDHPTFEGAWARSGFQMVAADPPGTDGSGAIRLGGAVTFVQASIPLGGAG